MRMLLICQSDEPLSREAMPRWLSSFSTLAGIVVIEETRETVKRRIRREWNRIGWFRFADVVAFRIYYRLFLQKKDLKWETAKLENLCSNYPEPAPSPSTFFTENPNSKETEEFIRLANPDIVIARCKTLLRKGVFSIPSKGTFVMHPGICPEYRNAHGCFWALAKDDRSNVGMTLLKIDEGIDTGPVYGYFRAQFDETVESHITIQNRTVFDNLPGIAEKLTEICNGLALEIDTSDRESGIWGQPWLTSYLRWKMCARKKSK